jgi:hypothetical protein
LGLGDPFLESFRKVFRTTFSSDFDSYISDYHPAKFQKLPLTGTAPKINKLAIPQKTNLFGKKQILEKPKFKSNQHQKISIKSITFKNKKKEKTSSIPKLKK